DSFRVATTTASAATWNWIGLTPFLAQVCQVVGGIGLEESTASICPEHSSLNAVWEPLLRRFTVTPLIPPATTAEVSEPWVPPSTSTRPAGRAGSRLGLGLICGDCCAAVGSFCLFWLAALLIDTPQPAPSPATASPASSFIRPRLILRL